MVNLRYHIVSLTAVFLALGLGILAGTTVIDQQVVSGLRANTAALRNDLDSARANLAELQRKIDVWDRFGAAIEPRLLDGLLPGRAVVIVSDHRVPGEMMTDLIEALTFANAKRPTRLTLTDKWTLDTSAEVEQLAQALRVQAAGADVVIEQASARLAGRLAVSSNPRSEGDLLRSLADADFLDIDDLPESGQFPAANAMVLVVSSGAPDASPRAEDFFAPMLKVLAPARVVGVAEPTGATPSLAELVRRDGDISRTVCTVDHADTVAGLLSIVYGLHDLGRGRPAAHYGVRGGATAVVPDVRPA